MIDKHTIEKIHDAAQIVDVVADFVTLRKRGVNYVGLCPFHEDRTPSFYVSPSKNICKCFSCGEGGNSVQFIMKHEQVSYVEALRYLAKKYHVEIKERDLSDEEKRMQSDRESMMIVNGWAQKFFTSSLYEHEEGRTIAMPYFMERGFREETIRKFQLGYCPEEKRNNLYKHAIERGFNETYLLKTGLVYKRDDHTMTDRFHGRVMFPVHTLSGKVVAFGGRLLGKKEKVAKYVNSPESEIYHKSSELYGIYFAKQAINKADKCYLVEGYTDVISMHQSGIENVVASSGTSLTYGQINLIHRFTNNITVLYDGDAAGIKAAIRGIDMLLEKGMNVKVVLLPDGEDPDSFARSHNSFDFILYINKHEVDFIRFKANLLLKDADNDPIKRANLIKEVMETVAVIPDSITRSVYIKECSYLFDEREQILVDEVMKIRSVKSRSAQTVSTAALSGAPAVPENTAADAGAGLTAGKTETVTNKREHRYFPFKKYESGLLRYVLRYGERILFVVMEAEDDPDAGRTVKIAEYIQSELQKDEIEVQTPIYKRILDEAVAQCKNEDFVASHYFLAHPDLEISELTAEMVSSKYQLSKYFRDPEEQALQQTAISEEQQEAGNEVRQREKEREQLERWIIHDLFTLKNAIVKHKIDEVNKQIKEFQSDEEKVVALLKERMALDRTKIKLSKALGERIVTGMGK